MASELTNSDDGLPGEPVRRLSWAKLISAIVLLVYLVAALAFAILSVLQR